MNNETVRIDTPSLVLSLTIAKTLRAKGAIMGKDHPHLSTGGVCNVFISLQVRLCILFIVKRGAALSNPSVA